MTDRELETQTMPGGAAIPAREYELPPGEAPDMDGTERRGARLRRTLEFLVERGGSADGNEVWEDVQASVPLLPEEVGLTSTGADRARVRWTWDTSLLTKAKWLVKYDGWFITDAGRQSLIDFPDDRELVSELNRISRMIGPRSPVWLIRGSSVSGRNLVPGWLSGGYISLPAKQLAEIPEPYERSRLRTAIDEGYANRTSSYRNSLVTTYDRFLGQMSLGDPVITTSEGRVHVGRVTGEPVWADDDALPARLRRSVAWFAGPGVPFPELPDPLPKRLGRSGDVIDLSEDREVIEAWMGDLDPGNTDPTDDGNPPPPPPPVTLGTLPPATLELASSLHLDIPWLDRLVRLLDRRKQVILYGPPGTGKTFIAQALAEHLTDEGNVTLVQFHPSYAYEDFVMGYRPVSMTAATSDAEAGGAGQGVRFALKNGPLMRIAEAARDNKAVPYVLIIDEINRANLAKVFGELYFLLEYRDRAINLLYSEDDSEDFHLPENLFIIGTMNTADRSIALVDAAMRRRFAFVELHPSTEPVSLVLRRWLAAQGHQGEAAALLDSLNSRIADKDFRIGPSYFMKDWIYTDPDGLDTVWETDFLPLLEEHHAGDGTDVPGRYGLKKLRAAIGWTESASAAPPPDSPVPGLVADTSDKTGRVADEPGPES